MKISLPPKERNNYFPPFSQWEEEKKKKKGKETYPNLVLIWGYEERKVLTFLDQKEENSKKNGNGWTEVVCVPWWKAGNNSPFFWPFPTRRKDFSQTFFLGEKLFPRSRNQGHRPPPRLAFRRSPLSFLRFVTQSQSQSWLFRETGKKCAFLKGALICGYQLGTFFAKCGFQISYGEKLFQSSFVDSFGNPLWYFL